MSGFITDDRPPVLRDASGKLDFQALVAAICDPQTGLNVKDRRYRGRAYRQCFVASQAVAWFMINCEDVKTEAEAVAVGQVLVDKGVIAHVVERLKPFTNEYLFFRFTRSHTQLIPAVEAIVKNADMFDKLIGNFVFALETKLSENKKFQKVVKGFTGTEAVDAVLLEAAACALDKGCNCTLPAFLTASFFSFGFFLVFFLVFFFGFLFFFFFFFFEQ